MEEKEINPVLVSRYLRALLSAYQALHPRPQNNLVPPATPEERAALALELSAKIEKLQAGLVGARAYSRTEKKRLRKIHAKLDIYKARLDRLKASGSG